MIPVTCPCGWSGTPQPVPWKVRHSLRSHQSSQRCPETPPEAPQPEECTILAGSCDCKWCRLAHNDQASPLDLGGQWVTTPRGTKIWEPA